mmetsp:Transcript_6743/g.12033  ORF Transcript_6743/g.12033 Transcript_6743/m.12033 type:complete len:287 (-) Transcript_6743:30-890(-)
MGSVRILEKRISLRKELKQRSHAGLVFLYNISRFVGKCMLIKKVNKKKRAFIVFRRLKLPIRRHVTKLRMRKALAVTAALERFCTANMLLRLAGAWKSKIIFVQKTLRPAITQHKERLEKFKKEWVEVETKLFHTRNSKLKKPKRVFVPIPDHIRTFLISEFIKGRFRKYFYERKKVMESIQQHYYEARTTSAITGKPMLLLSSAAAMTPALNLSISEDMYKKFISVAETNRLSWGKLSAKRGSVVSNVPFPVISLDEDEDSYTPAPTSEPRPRERRQALIPQVFN